MFEQTSVIRQAAGRLVTAVPAVAALRETFIRGVSPEAADLIKVGNRYDSGFRVMGRAPFPEDPVFVNNWWLVPIEQDSSQIPARAYERVQALYRAGLRPKGFVIAHEAPKLLSAPQASSRPVAPVKPLFDLKQLTSRPVLLTAGLVLFLVIAGPLLVKLLATLVAGLLSLLLLPVVLMTLGAGVLVDPCLIAVTEDGYWVEIDRWWS